MSEVEGSGRRLTISEETLRLQLAELELRLRIFLSEELAKKAAVEDLNVLKARFYNLDNGDFSDSHKRALTSYIAADREKYSKSSWTSRERFTMVVGLVVTVLMLVLSAYVVFTSTHQPVVNPQGQTK